MAADGDAVRQLSADATLALPPVPRRLPALMVVVRRHPVGAAAFLVIALIAFSAVASPLIAPYDPLIQDYDALLKGPSADHLLGTDQVGRDLLSRIIYGSRVSLVVGVVAVGLAIAVGTPLGLVAGYFGGVVDEAVMRVMDALAALPNLVLALAIVATLEASLINVMIAIGVASVPLYARLTRSLVLSLRERDFVQAAIATGASDRRIMLLHILPNATSPLIVQATLGLGFAILAEAGLGFLGVGVPPPTPTWGNILNLGSPLLERAPWLSIAPGMAIFILVLAFNLLGDALRDQLDPRTRKA
ncbi:MAG TPA: ABC transporter permease [Dehalococcoidia bacterium]|nr:ABC transporter permease [Dehalococcoidia bacterium]